MSSMRMRSSKSANRRGVRPVNARASGQDSTCSKNCMGVHTCTSAAPGAPHAVTRERNASAALRVAASTSSSEGCVPDSSRCAARCTIAWDLPVPGPPIT